MIRAGLEAIAPAQARPMLNSASLERLEALDLARAHDCRAVVTAAGERGMPDGSEARVANANRMVEAALARGFAVSDLYIDPLVFPISVDSGFGRHCLDAIRALRARFGADIHITGGMSNVSFGLPARRLLNDIFVLLAIEAGADGGILDPGGQSSGGDPRHRPGRPPLPPRRGRDAGARRALHGLYPRLAERPTLDRMSQPASKQETRAMTETERPPQDEPALRTLAMPADANPNGDIFGGWVLAQMDLAGGVVAARRAGGRMVTVAVEAMRFHAPIAIGDLVTCYRPGDENRADLDHRRHRDLGAPAARS